MAEEERVREDVEPHVPAEEGLGHAEEPGVPEPDHRLPLRRPLSAQHERDHETARQQEMPVEGLHLAPARELG